MLCSLIPRALFDDLHESSGLFDEPTCPSFLAVDAAIPTEAARLHLEFSAELGRLVRLDLKGMGSLRPAWLGSILHSTARVQRLLAFPGDLTLYVSPERAFDSSLRDRVGRRVLEISSMLGILERVVDEGELLGGLFHEALQLTRWWNGRGSAFLGLTRPLGVVGRMARPDLHPATQSHLRSFNQGEALFEHLRVSRATQLRVLWLMGLAAANPPLSARARFFEEEPSSVVPGGHRSFHDCTVQEHEQVADGLWWLIRRLRAAEYDADPGASEWTPSTHPYCGELEWFRWVQHFQPRSHEESRSLERFLVEALANLSAKHHDEHSVEYVARELVPRRIDDVFRMRRLASASTSRGL